MDEKYGNRQFAHRVIDETRGYWQKLSTGQSKADEKVISLVNATLNNGSTLAQADAEKILEADEKHVANPAAIDASVHQLFYIDDTADRATTKSNF